MPPAPPSLIVILVEPRFPGNVGMVARAMANFGAGELRLVSPCDHLDLEARKYALAAAPILEQARVYDSLAAALADLHLAVATTRRQGRNREVPLALTDLGPQLAALPPGRRVGLIFGREETGLTTDEVARCGLAVTIPTDPGFASLNLAQAVVLCLYELTRPAPAAAAAASGPAPTEGEWEELFAAMESVLRRIAFLNPAAPEGVMNRLRRLYRRAGPSRDDLQMLRGVWSQLSWSINDWRGRKRGAPPTKSD